ncbi:MAG: hypothetical protein IJZ34_11700 [Lachnospiraceae bacterium]|nr:hypothetical protein [Lachnospiraceae bacterium]
MENTINYLRQVFGTAFKTEYSKFCNALPMYMTERYQFHFIKLSNDKQSYVLVKSIKKQDINMNQLKKQMKQIYSYSDSLPIFVFESLRLSQRNVLIRNQIPFIQPDNQIYIPNVMINLSEKEILQKEYAEEFSIAAQVTYIYLLLNNIKETNAPRLAAEIPYSKITFNRALAELVSRELLYTVGNATRKIYKTIDREDFWKKGKKFLFNPVEKVFYANYKLDNRGLLISGETALSRLRTSLNEASIGFYASSSEKIKNMDKECFINKYDIVSEHYLVIEQFKYNPSFLSTSHYIDIISLYAQLKDSDDERIQIALEELLEELL